MVDRTRQASRRLVIGLMLAGLIVIAAPDRLAVQAQTAEGTVRIVPSFSTVFPDEGAFSIFIVVEELNHIVVTGDVLTEGLGAFEFTILYDPAVVEIAEAAPGPALESTGRSFQCFDRRDEPGSFSLGCASPGSTPSGPQGSFTLASVTLTPVSAGSTFLVLQAGIAGLLGEEVPIEVAGGAVVDVRGPIATAPPSPPSQPAPSTATPRAATATARPPSTAAGTAPPALTPTAGDDTPASPTQTDTPAPASGSETPGETAENSNDPPGDGGSTGVILWSILAAAGGLVVAGALGAMVVRWQRRR